VPFRNGLRYDNAIDFNLANNLALGKPISFAQPASSDYAPGDALVDGVMGSVDFHDGRWVAWNDNDLDATIDLQQDTPLHSIDIRFLMSPQSRILLPARVTFFASRDGKHWTSLYTESLPPDVSSPERIQRIGFHAEKPVKARYIRIKAERNTSLPPEFPQGAENTWLFTDEILVQ
jgi:hexosaminidase